MNHHNVPVIKTQCHQRRRDCTQGVSGSETIHHVRDERKDESRNSELVLKV